MTEKKTQDVNNIKHLREEILPFDMVESLSNEGPPSPTRPIRITKTDEILFDVISNYQFLNCFQEAKRDHKLARNISLHNQLDEINSALKSFLFYYSISENKAYYSDQKHILRRGKIDEPELAKLGVRQSYLLFFTYFSRRLEELIQNFESDDLYKGYKGSKADGANYTKRIVFALRSIRYFKLYRRFIRLHNPGQSIKSLAKSLYEKESRIITSLRKSGYQIIVLYPDAHKQLSIGIGYLNSGTIEFIKRNYYRVDYIPLTEKAHKFLDVEYNNQGYIKQGKTRTPKGQSNSIFPILIPSFTAYSS